MKHSFVKLSIEEYDALKVASKQEVESLKDEVKLLNDKLYHLGKGIDKLFALIKEYRDSVKP